MRTMNKWPSAELDGPDGQASDKAEQSEGRVNGDRNDIKAKQKLMKEKTK